MRLVTYRRGRAAARVGALADDVVFDLAALAADRASEQGPVRRGRGGFPKTMLALIQGATDAWNEARKALDYGLALLGREGLDRLAERRLASPLARVRLEAPIPRPARNVFCLGRNYKEHAAERGAEAPPHPVYFTKVPQSVLPPEGVGAATGKFLKVGDKIEAEVDKIGVLANRVVAPPADGA